MGRKEEETLLAYGTLAGRRLVVTSHTWGGSGILGVSVGGQKLLEEERRTLNKKVEGAIHTLLTWPFGLGPAWDPH